MSYGSIVRNEALRSIDSSTFTGSYQAVGSPLANPSYILKVVNNSDRLATVSFDGVTDHDIVPAGGFFLYDLGKVGQSGSFPQIPARTQIFVKGTSGGTGLVYVVSQFIFPS